MNEIKVAILQSNYIPWKGVFDLINMVDIFVFFDDVDFTKRDWRTRNKIKTPQGEVWLTVPVQKNHRGTKINEVIISQTEDWQLKHYKTIVSNYKKSKYFDLYKNLLNEIYLNRKWENLSEFNIFTTKLIAKELGILTRFICSSDLKVEGVKDERLLNICKEVNATEYISGPAAKAYINPELFKKNDIKLSYIVYKYNEYPQLYNDFDHNVSILDLLFNCGPDSAKYIFEGQKETVVL